MHLRLLCVRTSPLDVSTVLKCAIEVEQERYRGNVFVSQQRKLFNTGASRQDILPLTVAEGNTIMYIIILLYSVDT